MNTLIFDIGKTNKKYFIFDENFVVIAQGETKLLETSDEAFFPCEDIAELKEWVFKIFGELKKRGFKIDKLNFSTYGASFVHVNKFGLTDLPLYNYLKPMPDQVMNALYEYYPKEELALATSSPPLGMLNSGFQLFWLMNREYDQFNNIIHSLHLPNYLAFLFHDIPVADYTSIGCHTALWDFDQSDYHEWTFTEGISHLLKRPMPATTTFPAFNNQMKVGIGIHDSSAALLPYLVGDSEPFILISTGTWSITLNPFNREPLTINELEQDCLEFLSINGGKVKASRLFLGYEYAQQLALLNLQYNDPKEVYRAIEFDASLYEKVKRDNHKYFKLEALGEPERRNRNLERIDTFNWGYHQLIWELVQYQIKSIKLALGETKFISTIYIDGGFSKNDVFCQTLKHELPDFIWKKTQLAAGSALGAAIVVNMERFSPKHFNEILKVELI